MKEQFKFEKGDDVTAIFNIKHKINKNKIITKSKTFNGKIVDIGYHKNDRRQKVIHVKFEDNDESSLTLKEWRKFHLKKRIKSQTQTQTQTQPQQPHIQFLDNLDMVVGVHILFTLK